MKLSLLTTLMLIGASAAWEEDPRCKEFSLDRRAQEEGGDDEILDEEVYADVYETQQLTASESSPVTRSLRGATKQNQRELFSDNFQLKMFWEEGTCWQAEWIERKWCMACAGTECLSGQKLWVEACDSTKKVQRFTFIPYEINGTIAGKIKTVGAELCLEQISKETVLLNDCASFNKSQAFTGFRDDAPFELSPFGKRNHCLVNKEHHPKSREITYATSCKKARVYRTNFWIVFSGTDDSNLATASELTSLKLLPAGAECSGSSPCNTCQGDCVNDADCMGEFLCFKRSANETVPGCFGPGSEGKNYCYDPTSSAVVVSGVPTSSPTGAVPGMPTSNATVVPVEPSSNATIPSDGALFVVKEGCTPATPCGMCAGDCDTDDDCAGVLVCYQKDGFGTVPGCEGSSSSRTDFCGMP